MIFTQQNFNNNTMRIIVPSPILPLLIEAEEQGTTCVRFLRSSQSVQVIQQSDALTSYAGDDCEAAWRHLMQTYMWLDAYFARSTLPPMPRLCLCGTPFQRRVWNVLLQLPYGTTTTYGAIARRIGKPKAAQAVGQAVGANPVAIIVPCHRVLAVHGLGGYAYGLEVKSHLLSTEGSVLL